MSDKCGLSMSPIKTLNTKYILKSKTKEWSLSDLQKNFIEILKTMSDKMGIIDPVVAAEEIHNTLSKRIVSLNQTFFSPENILNVLTGVKKGYLNINSFSFDTDLTKEAEEVQLRKNITSKFLDNAYGTVLQAKDSMLQTASENLFDVMFINRGSIEGISLGAIKTTVDLNRNIKLYQEQLLRKMVQYLNTIINHKSVSENVKKALENPVLYRDNKNTGILTVLKPFIENHLSRKNFLSTNNSLDGLLSLYLQAQYDPKAKLHLDAYNAAVILQNFDSFMDYKLGDIINIKDVGIKTGADDKYSIARRTAKIAVDWNSKNDEIDVSERVSFITRLAITSTPFYHWGTSSKTNKYLKWSDFQQIASKIKSLVFIDNEIGSKNSYGVFQEPVYWNNLSEKTQQIIEELAEKGNVKFSTLINLTRKNSRKYVPVIFDLLTNEDFHTTSNLNNVFEEYDKDILQSLKFGIFGSTSNSIYMLSDPNTEDDYFSYITQIFNTITGVNHVQYHTNAEGQTEIRTFISQSIGNIRRLIEQTIIGSNNIFSISDIKSFKNELELHNNEYVIPETSIKVTYISPTQIRITENGKVVTDYSDYFKNEKVLDFLDQKLRLSLKNNIEFQDSLENQMQGKHSAMNNLLSFASDIIYNQIKLKEEFKSNEDLKKVDKILKDKFNSEIVYDNQLNLISVISKSQIPILRKIARAKANTLGVTSATQVKDSENNNQNLQTTSRLIGTYPVQFDLIERLKNSATRNSFILNLEGLLEGNYTSREYYNELSGTKAVSKMNVKELTYSNFVYDYIGGLIPRIDEKGQPDKKAFLGNGHISLLASVNSDKGIHEHIKLNLNKEIEGFPIVKLTTEDIYYLIGKSHGNFYTNMLNSILSDWKKLNDFIQSKYQLNPELTNSYLNDFKSFNEWWYKNQEILSEYGENPTEFISYMVRMYNEQYRQSPIKLIDQTHFKSTTQQYTKDIKIKNALGNNPVVMSLVARFDPEYALYLGIDISRYLSAENFWIKQNLELLKSMLDCGFEINTTGTKQSELLYLRKKKEWIDDSGNVILAKVGDINITSVRDLKKLGFEKIDNLDLVSDKIKLHPDIEKWNALSYLFTQEFMNCTVGSLINHPEKSSGKSDFEIISEYGANSNPYLADRTLIREAAHFQAQHKRNVSFTASMNQFDLNTLNGIQEEYRIAVIEDITDYQATINGILNKIKPFDGATYVHPATVILENNSLGGSKGGDVTKPFIHFKDPVTGTGGIIKTAGFGLTNNWMRDSLVLQNMFYKMSNHKWYDQNGNEYVTNITKNYKNEDIQYKNMYFEKDGNVYEIKKIESLDNNKYNRYVRQVQLDTQGRPVVGTYVGETFRDKENITIETNYQLWDFFGGARSMSVNGNYLQYSNSSVENLALAMNQIGVKINDEVETQDDLYQVLKHSDIQLVVTAGAIKQGAANINSNKRYYDNIPLTTFKIKMYQAGIQLDKEHHADDSELSLMTQVISACAALGYTFDQASKLYDALKTITDVGISEFVTGIKQYFEFKDTTAIKEAMYKAIINSLGTSKQNSSNFLYLVASNLVQQAKEGKNIKYSEVALPLSDNTVYSKVFSIVSSYLTNSGIKQKIPGILSVMKPSVSVYQLFAGRKLGTYKNPEKELAIKQAEFDANPIFNAELPESRTNTIHRLPLGRIYKLEVNTFQEVESLETGEIVLTPLVVTEYRLINDTTQYKQLKEEIKAKKVTKVTEAVVNHETGELIGRDLAAMNIFFETSTGEIFQLWDLDVIDELSIANKLGDTEKTKLLRRRLQKELNNLSKNGPDIMKQYDAFLSKFLNSESELFSTDINERVIDQNVGHNLSILSSSLQKLILSYPLFDLPSKLSKKEMDKHVNFMVNKYFQESDKLSQLDQDILFNILNTSTTNVDPTVALGYYLHTGRTFKEDFDIKSQEVGEEQALKDLTEISGASLSGYSQTIKGIKNNYDLNNLSLKSFDRYARWVNIYLGTGHGNLIEIDGKFETITSENFNEIEPKVRQILEDSTKIRIDGKLHSVDKNSIDIQAYELIMSKTFANKFGLNEFVDLAEIRDNREWFVEQYRLNKAIDIANGDYSLALLNSNGKHLYLLDKSQINTLDKSFIKVDTQNIGLMNVDGTNVRTDEKGNTMYEVTEDLELYRDEKGHEIIVTNDLTHYLNNLSFDSIQFSPYLQTNYTIFEKVISDISESSDKDVKKFYKFLDQSFRNRNFRDVYKASLIYNEIPDINDEFYNDNSLIRSLHEKHTSFLKSLDVIAARIPAQSLQSVMPMKVVAFEDANVNVVYVSDLQVLLQGSDYDIDAVSVATFDIDNNGKLQTHSPYADIETVEKFNASMQLPIPTGLELQLKQSSNSFESAKNFLINYYSLLNISRKLNPTKETITENGKEKTIINYIPSDTELNVNIKKRLTSDQIVLLSKFLNDINNLEIPPTHFFETFAETLNFVQKTDIFTSKHIESLFNGLVNIANTHNLYFNKIGKKKLSRIANNLTMYNMYEISKDPINLLQSHISVDATTGPFKKIGNASERAGKALYRAPGNVVNMFEALNENEVGKDCIGVSAVGLKTFFGLTHYCNYLLNKGDVDSQGRLLLNKGKGITIGGKTYKTLANVRAVDINTIKNSELFAALSEITQDEDAALSLSSLLSLSVDNAKELQLDKLNAGRNMIGMYIFGLSIGMKFNDIANIIMSPVGNLFRSLTEENVLTSQNAYGNIDEPIFKYFTEGPQKQLFKFDSKTDSEGHTVQKSPLDIFKDVISKEFNIPFDNGHKLLKQIGILNIADKIQRIEKYKNSYTPTFKGEIIVEKKEEFNQLIDFAIDYMIQFEIVKNNQEAFKDLKKLAQGAKEFKIFGQIFGLNKGVKTKTDEYFNQLNNIKNLIFDHTGEIEDIVRLTDFVQDENYRNEVINKYENIRTTLNIFDALTCDSQYFGYLTTLAASELAFNQTFKYRSINQLLADYHKTFEFVNSEKLIKGLQNYCGDYLLNSWMINEGITVTIPAGQIAYDRKGNPSVLTEDKVLYLGLEHNNMTFKAWIENKVIPDLQKGLLRPNDPWVKYSNNQFIQNLGYNTTNRTVSGNNIIVRSLPINMMPSNDVEQILFDQYKSEFNQLTDRYQYTLHRKNKEGKKEEYLSKPIPVTDLITYYAMIANRWLVSQSSLVPIVQDFRDKGILKKYDDYISNLDKSGFTLFKNNIVRQDLLPYVALKESEFVSTAPFVFTKDPGSKIRTLKSRYYDNEEHRFKYGRVYKNKDIEQSVFEKGGVNSTKGILKFNTEWGEVSVQYDLIHGKLKSIKLPDIDNKEIKLSKIKKQIKKVPIVKLNGVRVVDKIRLMSKIENVINNC